MASHQPDVYFRFWPSHTYTSLLPENLPPTVPPPVTEGSFRSPFGIDPELYNAVLSPAVPFTFATIYVIAVLYLNAYNDRNKQAWLISKRKWFPYFVIAHNVVLAIFSTATFVAMSRAIAHTWPGDDLLLRNVDNWKPKVADALCKLHGPRGFGDAATYNTTINIWESKNTAIKMLNGNPDPTDVGRLWNEGLAFWGWMFYVSKFYEVIDTLIILAKGKRSAFLQTYHHAGAMLCMWAGIRYMSPPIWMFVFVNSGIHAWMYVYYTLSALNIQVPQGLKRTLTLLQIGQFIWGSSYAAAHLFVKYDIPLTTPFTVASVIERAAPSVKSAASAASATVSTITSNPTALLPTGAALASSIKKLLLRAAGEEGVAERVGMQRQDALIPAAPAIEQKIERFYEDHFETQYRTEMSKINCIDTTGEAFAIYLNLLYLAPLTILFLRFFVRAYTERGKGKGQHRSPSEAAKDARDAAREAEKKTRNKFDEAGKEAEGEVYKRADSSSAKDLAEQVRKDIQSVKEGAWWQESSKTARKVSERVQSYEGKMKEKVKDVVDGATRSSSQASGRRESPSKKSGDRPNGENIAQNESAIEDEPKQDEQDQQSQQASGDGTALSPRTSRQDEETAGDDKENQPPQTSANDDDVDVSSEHPGGDEFPKGSESSTTTETPRTLEDSQLPIAPGAGNEDDSDAMGKSGINVDDDNAEQQAGDEEKTYAEAAK